MKTRSVDIAIIGAGPVGLMCAFLGELCGLRTLAIDKSTGPLDVGRADALNARTLQLLELVGLFDELYPIGKICNTSSVWSQGKFLSRESTWWESLEGCLHKHFLMLGQSYVEKLIDKKLHDLGAPVLRETVAEDIQVSAGGCKTTLSNGDIVYSKYLIGADGSRSFVRNHFQIPFQIERPQIVWAVIDGIIDTDFNKVPEIIVFQAETADVAWIPREGEIDRFYVRMDVKDFELQDAIAKINLAMAPHTLRFRKIVWFSQFSVKESVAENFMVDDRVFLAGDACHIHSVNGGQGLNTGLADAFNLVWKLNLSSEFADGKKLLDSYETERMSVAKTVIESSGELVRSTKHSHTNTHAQDYVKIVRRRSGNITGMGVRYGSGGMAGDRIHDFFLLKEKSKVRLYSLLDYTKFTLLYFSDCEVEFEMPSFVKVMKISSSNPEIGLFTEYNLYKNMAILVRPDSYIESALEIKSIDNFTLTYCLSSRTLISSQHESVLQPSIFTKY